MPVAQLLGLILRCAVPDWNGFLKAAITIAGVATVSLSQPMIGLEILFMSVCFESLAGIQAESSQIETLKSPLIALSYFSPVPSTLGGKDLTIDL